MKNVKILTIRSYNWSAKLIHIGMWLWAVLRFKKPHKIDNHTEVAYEDENGVWWTSGAISEGVKTRRLDEYLASFKRAEYHEFPIEISEKKFRLLKKYLDDAENTPYEFENFLWHLIKIIFGVWIGSKTSKKTYCYEHTIRAMQASEVFTEFFNAGIVSIFDNPYQFYEYSVEKHIVFKSYYYHKLRK